MNLLRIECTPILKLKKFSPLDLVCLVYLLSYILFFPADIFAYEITMAWSANDDPDLEGYILYSRIGNPCPPYNDIDAYPENQLANPLLPMVKVTNLETNTRYYFVVTAYDKAGNESGYSNIIYVDNGQWGNAKCSSSQISAKGGGGGCFIATSTSRFRGIKDILAKFYLLLLGLVSFSIYRKRLPKDSISKTIRKKRNNI